MLHFYNYDNYRHIDKKTEKIVKELKAFYFLPDPIALAFDHHCYDPPWALLPDANIGHESEPLPRSLVEFENDPRLPGFIVFRCSEVGQFNNDIGAKVVFLLKNLLINMNI